MEFGKFGLGREILGAIRKAGYERPTPVQAAAIPKVMRGEDVIGIAQTGTGKTAAFVLPMLEKLTRQGGRSEERGGRREGTWSGKRGKSWRPARALVLVPTRELALQIVENVRKYGASLPVRVAAIFGGVEEEAQLRALQKGVDIVVATPGRLMDLVERGTAEFGGLETLVLDEADRMLHMGFLPDIEKIVAGLPERRQTLMFSATFPKEVDSLARRFLHKPVTVQLGKRTDAAVTVRQEVHEVPPHLKTRLLLALLKEPGFTRVLVFTRMKEGANRLAEALREAGVKVARLHSSRTQDQRLKALGDFKEGKVQVLVATDIVARGIDIEGVSQVVNYDFPVNPEDYVHRIGRTGRAEQAGVAISFVPKDEANLLGITEMAIGQRLEKKRLRGFDYRAPAVKGETTVVAKKDWRKIARRKTQDGKTQEKKSAESAVSGDQKRGKKRKREGGVGAVKVRKPTPPEAKKAKDGAKNEGGKGRKKCPVAREAPRRHGMEDEAGSSQNSAKTPNNRAEIWNAKTDC